MAREARGVLNYRRREIGNIWREIGNGGGIAIGGDINARRLCQRRVKSISINH